MCVLHVCKRVKKRFWNMYKPFFLESVCTYVQSLHSDASVLHYTYNSLDAIFSLTELPSLYISLVNYKPRQAV